MDKRYKEEQDSFMNRPGALRDYHIVMNKPDGAIYLIPI